MNRDPRRNGPTPREGRPGDCFHGGLKLIEGRSQRCTTDRNPLSRLCRTPRSCGGTRSAPGDELMYRRFAHQGPVGMPKPSTMSTSTTVVRFIKAPRKAVYEAFLDPAKVASWLPPGTMRGQVHAYDAREGGRFSMSLTYPRRGGSPRGKTTDDTDTFHGRFDKLVPDQKIVWVVEFESKDSAFAGEMRVTWHLAEAGGGTEVTVLCEGIPPGVRPEDNEAGSISSLRKLAALVEQDGLTAPPKKRS